jgi:hypothetical protein
MLMVEEAPSIETMTLHHPNHGNPHTYQHELSGQPLMPSHDKKLGKNRVHFDLRPDDQLAEVRRLEALGAARVDKPVSRGW